MSSTPATPAATPAAPATPATSTDLPTKMNTAQWLVVSGMVVSVIVVVVQIYLLGTKSTRRAALYNVSGILGFLASMTLIHTSFTSRNQARLAAGGDCKPLPPLSDDASRIVSTMKWSAVISDLACMTSMLGLLWAIVYKPDSVNNSVLPNAVRVDQLAI